MPNPILSTTVQQQNTEFIPVSLLLYTVTYYYESNRTHQRIDCTIDNAGDDGDSSSAVVNLTSTNM